MLGVLYTNVRARLVGTGSGAKFGRKLAQNVEITICFCSAQVPLRLRSTKPASNGMSGPPAPAAPCTRRDKESGYRLNGLLIVWFGAQADFREDEKISLAPDVSVDSPPSGATAGPGSPGNGSGSKSNAGCTKKQPRRPHLRPSGGQLVILDSGRQNIKR
jgi:hypothetical protein